MVGENHCKCYFQFTDVSLSYSQSLFNKKLKKLLSSELNVQPVHLNILKYYDFGSGSRDSNQKVLSEYTDFS